MQYVDAITELIMTKPRLSKLDLLCIKQNYIKAKKELSDFKQESCDYANVSIGEHITIEYMLKAMYGYFTMYFGVGECINYTLNTANSIRFKPNTIEYYIGMSRVCIVECESITNEGSTWTFGEDVIVHQIRFGETSYSTLCYKMNGDCVFQSLKYPCEGDAIYLIKAGSIIDFTKPLAPAVNVIELCKKDKTKPIEGITKQPHETIFGLKSKLHHLEDSYYEIAYYNIGENTTLNIRITENVLMVFTKEHILYCGIVPKEWGLTSQLGKYVVLKKSSVCINNIEKFSISVATLPEVVIPKEKEKTDEKDDYVLIDNTERM